MCRHAVLTLALAKHANQLKEHRLLVTVDELEHVRQLSLLSKRVHKLAVVPHQLREEALERETTPQLMSQRQPHPQTRTAQCPLAQHKTRTHHAVEEWHVQTKKQLVLARVSNRKLVNDIRRGLQHKLHTSSASSSASSTPKQQQRHKHGCTHHGLAWKMMLRLHCRLQRDGVRRLVVWCKRTLEHLNQVFKEVCVTQELLPLADMIALDNEKGAKLLQRYKQHRQKHKPQTYTGVWTLP